MSGQSHNQIDVPAIVASLPDVQVCFLESVDSTNDFAKRELAQNELSNPFLVLTSNQTAGRGQFDRTWVSDSGSLTFSLALRSETVCISNTLIPIATGISVATVIRQLAPGCQALLKWPNDVVLDNRKSGGILVETLSDQYVIIGIGLNVNNSESLERDVRNTAPNSTSDLDSESKICGLRGVTSIAQVFGEPISISKLVTEISVDLMKRLRHPSESKALCEDFNRLSYLKGATLQLALPNGNLVEGTYDGIADCGSLLLAKDDPKSPPIKIASGRILKIVR